MPTGRRAGKGADAVVSKTHEALDVAAEATPKLGHRRGPRLPAALHFPIVATLSFAIASLGYSLLGEFTKGELAAVSRTQDTWSEVAILAGWRLMELGLAWYGGLDSLDIAVLDVLSRGPSLYLLTAFYNLAPATALSAVVIDALSAAVPFYLLRPLSAVHTPSAKVPNRELVDLPVQLYTAALSTGIYTVTLVLALHLILPSVLVTRFNRLPSIEPAYSTSYLSILPVTVLFGAAASTFIFAPFATTGRAKEDDKIDEFSPADATLGETVKFNFWGYTAKAKVVIMRTILAMLLSGVNTYLQCSMTIYGIEATGAAIYASIWSFSALCTGLGLAMVGGE